MWGRTSWKEKLLCIPVVIALIADGTENMWTIWIGGACLVALLSMIFKLGVEDE